jgi:hypothetical protein
MIGGLEAASNIEHGKLVSNADIYLSVAYRREACLGKTWQVEESWGVIEAAR